MQAKVIRTADGGKVIATGTDSSSWHYRTPDPAWSDRLETGSSGREIPRRPGQLGQCRLAIDVELDKKPSLARQADPEQSIVQVRVGLLEFERFSAGRSGCGQRGLKIHGHAKSGAESHSIRFHSSLSIKSNKSIKYLIK
jgi:hypothetical protein